MHDSNPRPHAANDSTARNQRGPARRDFLGRLGGLVAAALLPGSVRAGRAATELQAAPEAPPSWPRGSDGYESQRRRAVWQAMKPDRYPDLIVHAESEADIVETLRHAADRSLPVAVRCGGHSYVAAFLRDGGILLDVSRLRRLDIDRERKTFHAQPGVSAAEVSALLAEEGLAFPVAHAPTVTLGGYLLGGGMGWNGESWGRIACDNVRSLTMVSAAAERLTISDGNHPDLFRAARGAGPAFCGAVTGFRLRAFPRPPAILHSTWVFPAQAASRVAVWLQQAAAAGIADIELTLVLGNERDGTQVRPVCIATATAFDATPEHGESALRAIGRSAPRGDALNVEERREVTMADLFAVSATGTPRRLAADNVWTMQPLDAVDRMGAHFAAAAAPDSVVIVNFRGGTGRPDGLTYSVGGAAYVLWMASWSGSDADEPNLRWVDRAAELLDPLATGCYVNETDFVRRPERVRRCYSPEAWAHIRKVRARYDPQDRFPAPFAI